LLKCKFLLSKILYISKGKIASTRKNAGEKTEIGEMSLNFNSITPSAKPVIREAANMANDGGGGNLGYMMQGEREEKKFKQEESIFAKEQDIFGQKTYESLPEKFSLAKLIAQVIYAIKSLFK
jgi:hypothetical protein